MPAYLSIMRYRAYYHVLLIATATACFGVEPAFDKRLGHDFERMPGCRCIAVALKVPLPLKATAQQIDIIRLVSRAKASWDLGQVSWMELVQLARLRQKNTRKSA